MDAETIDILRELNGRFYREQAASFDATRHGSWPGWERLLASCGHLFETGHARLYDMACGNLRFERFLLERYPACTLDVRASDNCPQLVAPTEQVVFEQRDILAELLEQEAVQPTAEKPGACDLAVSFAFLHHVPTQKLRVRVLEELASHVGSGGYVAVSLWRFMRSERIAQLALDATERGCARWGIHGLEAGDYLLGWQNKPDAFRYCHHFSDDEVRDLAQCLDTQAVLVDSYVADGRNGDLNAYLVWERL